MKNEHLIRAIGTIDEDLIERAERHDAETVKNVPSKRRVLGKPIKLVASIAAIMLVGVSICYAGGVFDSFFYHFSGGGDMDRYADYIMSTITSASNEDLEIGIAGAVMDAHQCFIVFTAQALSDAGIDVMNKQELLNMLEITAVFGDGKITQPNYGATYHKGSQSKSAASYVIEIRSADIELESIQTLYMDCAGLSLKLDMQAYNMESTKLYSDDPNALEVVEMSPIGIYAEVPVNNTEPKAMRELSASIEMIPILADGALADEYSLHGTNLYNEEKKIIQVYMSFVMIEDATLKTEIADLSLYSGFRINGIHYYLKGT